MGYKITKVTYKDAANGPQGDCKQSYIGPLMDPMLRLPVTRMLLMDPML